MKKIVVIGLGNVGVTYVANSVATGLQAEWIFIDKNIEVADAHAHDFGDMVSLMPRNNSSFRVGSIEDSKGADIVVITASIPAGKGFRDRLALAGANAKLMSTFGEGLKKAGFKGVVIVASNPCDVMAAAIHYSSGIPYKKVLSTGTLLDSARFRKLMGHRFHCAPDSVKGYILGEHGESAMAAWSQVKIGDTNIKDLIKSKAISDKEFDSILKDTANEAFYIYSRKGNTQFGIAMAIYQITDAIFNNKRAVLTVGVKLPKGYKHAGIWTSIPAIVGEDGYEYLEAKPSLNKSEWEKFEASTSKMAKAHCETLELIDIKLNLK